MTPSCASMSSSRKPRSSDHVGRVTGRSFANKKRPVPMWWRAVCIKDDSVRASFRIAPQPLRSEEHTSELQSLMRISYAVFCLKKKKIIKNSIKKYNEYRRL